MSFEPNYVTNTADLRQIIINEANKPIVVIFSAKWCAPCKKLKEYLFDKNGNGFCKEQEGKIKFVFVDIDLAEDMCEDVFNIRKLPTSIIYRVMPDKNNNPKLFRLHRTEPVDFQRLEQLVNSL